MNNHPKDINVSFLKEMTLIQIGIGQNEIVLNFQGNEYHVVALTIESDIGVIHKNDDLKLFSDDDQTHIAASAMAEFLGKDIKEVIYNEDGSLTLIFENGGSIFLYNNNTHYVSYAITYKDQSFMI